MRVLSLVAGCLVLAVAARARAQEAEEPADAGETAVEIWTETETESPAPAATAAPSAAPRAALLVTATARAGATDEAERHGRAAGGLESALLVAHGPVQLGARLALDANGEEATLGGALTLGASVPVRPGLRLDLHGDLGLTHYSRDSGTFLVVVNDETEGSSATLGTAALRAGVTFASWRDRFVTVGAFARSVAREKIEYTVRSCVLVFCTEEQRSITYGGTTVGAFVTVGSTYRPSRWR